MFDMSWGEVLVIGAVALVVIGPKELPKALRTLGNMTAGVRKMAGEFQTQFNEAMREAELDEIKKQVSGLNDEVSSIGKEMASLNTTFDPISGTSASSADAAAGSAAPIAPAAEAPAPASAAPLPGEPAFDLALPAPAAEPAPESGASGDIRPAESKA
jgi:sec-independent protein translocase protein TatB